MIGFETTGNATITIFDDIPVLTTDPWINGKPYFGSWSHAYEIPKEQLNNILVSKYIWLSHGHPDHIDPDSLDLFKEKIGSDVNILDQVGLYELCKEHQLDILLNFKLFTFSLDW